MSTIGVITLYLIYNLAYFLFGCVYDFKSMDEYKSSVYKPLQMMTEVLFAALAVLFIVIAVILI